MPEIRPSAGGAYPGVCVGKKDGPIPHPTDCAQDVQCWKGTGSVMKCNNGLGSSSSCKGRPGWNWICPTHRSVRSVFNPAEKVKTCDFLQNVPSCHRPADTDGSHDPRCLGRAQGEAFRHDTDCQTPVLSLYLVLIVSKVEVFLLEPHTYWREDELRPFYTVLNRSTESVPLATVFLPGSTAASTTK